MNDEAAPAAVVVGTGFGARVHVPALRGAGFDVVGIVGRDPSRTARRAERAGVDASFASVTEAVSRAEDRPVLVTVATPPDTHAAVVEEALAARAHVICEKPFTLNAAEARRLADLAAESGSIAVIGHEFRFAPDRAALGVALANGEIGQPRLATFMSTIDLLTDASARAPAWWFDPARGGGWLGASGSHAVDQIQSWLGDVVEVSATLGLVDDGVDDEANDEAGAAVEDSFVVHFRTASGTNGVLVQSARDWGTPIELTRVTGSTGTVWLDRSAAWIADGTGRRRLEPPPWAAPPPAEPSRDVRHRFTHLELGPWTRLAAWVADALAGRWPWPPTRGPEVAPATFIQGVSTMEVLDAVRSSAAERGAVIPVELIRTGG